ncbi:hypothetical protein TNIN_258311 [Trichonephila inaurata madagascariensis]|uniref:Uncharacterized protein n=1 Tax=Trichonephila inaurata madagascariensis TaxID=2747483 RepID=A0A8X6JCY5_9ARAC|nr:hypothetical protein TNIN_258311 [Trichonephila inaurata madagascariensis]
MAEKVDGTNQERRYTHSHPSKVSCKSQLVRCACTICHKATNFAVKVFPGRTRLALLQSRPQTLSEVVFRSLGRVFLGTLGVVGRWYMGQVMGGLCASIFRGIRLPAVCGNAGVLNFSPDFWKSVEFFRFLRKEG